MKSEYAQEIKKYAIDISNANNEAAKISLLTNLLTRLFDGNHAKEVIRQFSLGTERAIFGSKKLLQISLTNNVLCSNNIHNSRWY